MCVPGFSGKYRERKFDLETYSIFISKPGFCRKSLPKQTTQTKYPNRLKIQATHTVCPKPNRLKTQATQTHYSNKTKNAGYPNILSKQTTQKDCLNQLPKQITQTTDYLNRLPKQIT